ncbi:MAG: DUF4435 domain-containing protein [Gallionellaceae bacterium]|nr:DUF4435 domain-containing protein [Gallionellaceae bacterium]
MTVFTRTPSGQNNQALFYGVDRVVYVEGDGDDQAFWTEVFRAFSSNGRSYKFKSVGSRSTVEEYAELIIGNKSGNCVAIIDSDYEALKSTLFNWPNVIYTYGYSYENDLLGTRQALRILYQLTGNRLALSNVRLFLKTMRRLNILLSRITPLDLRANVHGNALLPKNGKTCRLSVTGDARFPICRKSISAIFTTFRNSTLDISPPIGEEGFSLKDGGLRWSYGHLIKSAICTLIGKIWRSIFSGKLSNDLVENVALNSIRTFGKSFFPLEQRNYYSAVIGQIR